MLSFLYSPALTSIHDYWKNHSLTRWVFVSKVMSLLFNMLSRFVIAFLPRSKCLLISWLQSPSAVILELKKIKSVNLSQPQGLFKWVSSLHQVAKVLEFQLNISPTNEHPGLISFRMDCSDFLTVQGTLKSLLQHHSSKASILQCSAFFIVQLSSIHDYWKNHSFD